MSFSGVTQISTCCEPVKQYPSSKENLIILELTGFLYTHVPFWTDDKGNRLYPLQLRKNFCNYTWKFHKPTTKKLCDMVLYLHTSDDIKPTIFEKISNKMMKVYRDSIYQGYTIWKISC